jgi:hypothetical protein
VEPITDQVTTHHISDTKVIEGKVSQLAPGGFVLLDSEPNATAATVAKSGSPASH